MLTAILVVPLLVGGGGGAARRRLASPLGQHSYRGDGQQQQQHAQFGGHDETSVWRQRMDGVTRER